MVPQSVVLAVRSPARGGMTRLMLLSFYQGSFRFILCVADEVSGLPDQYFLYTRTDGRESILKLGQDTIGECALRQQVSIERFIQQSDHGIFLRYVPENAFEFKTENQPDVEVFAQGYGQHRSDGVSIRVQHRAI